MRSPSTSGISKGSRLLVKNKEEVVNSHEEHDAQNIANEEEKSENGGSSGDKKESDTDDKVGEWVNDSTKEENHSEEEDESECEVSSDEDDVPLSEVGKKPRKTPMKATQSTVPTRKGVAPPTRTPVTRSKRKVVDEQVIKEFRSARKPRKKVSIVEPVVEMDGEDESYSAFPAKSSTPKRKVAKVTKTATSSARASRGKTRKNVPVVVDRLIDFRNGKVLNGKILANTDEKGMAQLVEKHELQR
uniref:FK506-binding protein 4-like n=1 Tax=Nicotiana tabacum TaxID=4097 RepID=A0A1S3Z8V1_TOBAC|nr:PREDICTED: FK506-binding protein 4-like [Nicotiana tabacum]